MKEEEWKYKKEKNLTEVKARESQNIGRKEARKKRGKEGNEKEGIEEERGTIT